MKEETIVLPTIVDEAVDDQDPEEDLAAASELVGSGVHALADAIDGQVQSRMSSTVPVQHVGTCKEIIRIKV